MEWRRRIGMALFSLAMLAAWFVVFSLAILL